MSFGQALGEVELYKTVQMPPVDESGRDPELAKTLKSLKDAVDAKDVSRLLGYIDKNIKCSFGGDGGVEEFNTTWELDRQPRESRLWGEMADVLELGGVFREANFIMPYLSGLQPGGTFDSFVYSVITGRNVNVREEPSRNSAVISSESYLVVNRIYQEMKDIVEETIDGETHPWVKIVLPPGQVGFIYGKYVRSPIDYRAFFEKKEGTWKMTVFIAGD